MMINANKIISISALLAVLFLSSIARAEEWKHEFTPYAWMSDLKTTAGGANVSATSDIDFFDDLLPLVDAGWMHMYEARQNNLSLMNEVVYMKISEGVSDSGPLGFVSTSVKGVYEQGLVDLFGGYTPNHGNTTFFGGLRYIFLDVDVDASVSVIPPGTVVKASGQRDEHWVDPVIGVRHIIPLTDKLTSTIKVDVGGGLDSEFSSVTTLDVKYAMTDSVKLMAGYRYARIDKDDSELLFDQTLKGFLIGVGFEF